VGVVQDFRQTGLDAEPNPEVFVPLAQLPLDAWKVQFAQEFATTHFLVARTTGDPFAARAAVQEVVSRLDPDIAVANVGTMESRLSDSVARRRFVVLLLSGFAGLALVLALVGLYGVMAYTVSERRNELGVRAALGASAAALLQMVLVDGLRITVIGTAIGLLLAGALSRVIVVQLFHVKAMDPIVYGGVALLFVAVACLASAVPGLRAARIDPADALRSQ
jgi:ABC-type antimicrobial peptide transport system permease subunit